MGTAYVRYYVRKWWAVAPKQYRGYVKLVHGDSVPGWGAYLVEFINIYKDAVRPTSSASSIIQFISIRFLH